MLENLICRGFLPDGRPCLKLLARTSLEKFGTVEIKCPKCHQIMTLVWDPDRYVRKGRDLPTAELWPKKQ